MSFLDENGLAYFYSKLKEKFIRTITAGGKTLIPDINGNVAITNVATADNLTSPDGQTNYDVFIYRTSGGSANLASGEAELMYIDGNMEIRGRVTENIEINANNDLNVNLTDISKWRASFPNTGTYTLNYIKPNTSAAVASWTASGTWQYNGTSFLLSAVGLQAINIVDPYINVTAYGSGISSATVVPSTFGFQIANDGLYTFIYNTEASSWQLDSTNVELSNYGLIPTLIEETPQDGDTISVNYITGTPNSVVIVNYTAPVQGTIYIATPQTFSATGFNQFDKESMVLPNASISNGKIIQNSGTNVCYCKAKGGVPNGYIAYSESGQIIDIGWCATQPVLDSDIITTGSSYSSTASSITFNDDGYVVVVTNSTSDLCIHPKWSGSNDDIYEEYVEPSTIPIPTLYTVEVQGQTEEHELPTALYGMPSLAGYADRINFETGTYIKKIERLENTTENMADVIEMGVIYDYDANYIYYVMPEPITYTIKASQVELIYTVNDFGTEEFIGTNVPVGAQTLYGQNLRDKLRTDVVTISEQSLFDNQKIQVCENIGAVSKFGDTMTGDLHIEDASVVINDTRIVSGTAPSANIYGRSYYLMDKNNFNIGAIQIMSLADGREGFQLVAGKNINGVRYNNYMRLNVDVNGNSIITLSDSKAWRSELGLGTSGALPITIGQGGTGQTANIHITKISDIATAASGWTITGAQYYQWGKFVQIRLNMKATATVATGSDVPVATLVAGKRPPIETAAICPWDTINYAFIKANGQVVIRTTAWAATSEKYICSSYILP